MDIDKLTIPPELFYPKRNKVEELQRKILKAIPKIALKTSSVRKKVFRKKRNDGPRLGRINHEFLRAVKAKKNRLNAMQKRKDAKLVKTNTSQTDSENRAPNQHLEIQQLNISTNSISSPKLVEHRPQSLLIKPSQIKVTPAIAQKTNQKQIKQQEQEQRQMLYVEDDFEPNRMSGGSFKFFKTKNTRPDASTDDDEFRGELNTSSETIPTDKPEMNDFEEDIEPEFSSEANIESLLQQLDGDDEDSFALQHPTVEEPIETLEEVIDILQSVGIQKISRPISNFSDIEKSSGKTTKFLGKGTKQLQLDAGQKRFGIVDCKECGLHYNTNVPEDEMIHEKHHQEMLLIPRFKGWANENAIQINGLDESSRIIRLEPGHKNLESTYVTDILQSMTNELGVLLHDHHKFHIYLAVYAAKIVGICAAEDSVIATKAGIKKQVRLGIQRLYVRPAFRRKGIAKAILKTAMLTHFKGQMLEFDDFAFSSPTDDGTKFVQKITCSKDFYVY